MDAQARQVVEGAWCARFGLTVEQLRRGGAHLVVDDHGRNDAMSVRLGDACIVVTRALDLPVARDLSRDRGTDEVYTRGYLERLLGAGTQIDGPSQHSYVTARTFRGTPDPAVVPIAGTDDALLQLLDRCGPDTSSEVGFPPEPASADPRTTRFYGLTEDGELVAAGNMTEWRGLAGDVGVLTRPDARRRGLATRVAATMTADALATTSVVRYRALTTNTPSLTVASRLGFEPYGENYRARRQT
jgi:GNAT superfamily N-acetyltransferase